MPRSVLLGLSGGADSAAAAVLLQQSGYTVIGAVLDLSPAASGAVEAAQKTADALGIPLRVVRDHALFDEKVIAPFCAAYRAGETPNPCVLCNPQVKFRLLCQEADRCGCEKIATGHYARIGEVDGLACIRRAASEARDQSYMLASLTRPQIERLLLPLGEMPDKSAVRAVGRAFGLEAADAPDSQEICFIPDGDYSAYIDARLGPEPTGDFIAPDGKPCGKHLGISHYTVGQRKGLGIALGRPVFIRSIDAATRQIQLVDADQAFFPEIRVGAPHWQLPAPTEAAELCVKIRSAAPLAKAVWHPNGRLCFDQPQRAPAPGQAAVFYRDDCVWGSAPILQHV